MPKGILSTESNTVNKIEICIPKTNQEALSINDLLENTFILLRYIISRNRGRINMRKEIIKLLKDFESGNLVSDHLKTHMYDIGPDSSYEDCTEYYKEEERNKLLKYISDSTDSEHSDFNIITYLHTPNTQLLFERIKDLNFSEGHLKAELRRMESDGLVLIGRQDAEQSVVKSNGDFSWFTRGKDWAITTDSIVLTTKGKNSVKYLVHQFNFWALIISIISLGISVYFNLPES